MEKDQYRLWRSLQIALACLRGQAFQTPRISKRREQLVEAEKTVAELFRVQVQNARGDATYTKILRVDLRKKHLNPMNADGLLYLDGEPGIKDLLRLPPAHIADQKLIEAAKRIIKNVRPFADTFIENGWEPHFIERAVEAVEALELDVGQPGAKANERALATASLPEALLKGRKIVNAITRLVQDDLADDPGARKLWMRAKRVPATMGRPKYPRAHRVDGPPQE